MMGGGVGELESKLSDELGHLARLRTTRKGEAMKEGLISPFSYLVTHLTIYGLMDFITVEHGECRT